MMIPNAIVNRAWLFQWFYCWNPLLIKPSKDWRCNAVQRQESVCTRRLSALTASHSTITGWFTVVARSSKPYGVAVLIAAGSTLKGSRTGKKVHTTLINIRRHLNTVPCIRSERSGESHSNSNKSNNKKADRHCLCEKIIQKDCLGTVFFLLKGRVEMFDDSLLGRFGW